MGKEIGQGREFAGLRFGGDEEIDIGGVADLLDKLPAVAAGGGGDGQVLKMWLRIEGEIDEEELLSVDRMMKRQVRELEVDADEDPAGGAEAHGANVVLGDGRAGENFGRGNKRGEELEDRKVGPLGHGFNFWGWDYKSGLLHSGGCGVSRRFTDDRKRELFPETRKEETGREGRKETSGG